MVENRIARDKFPLNAECKINYAKKEIDFNYPGEINKKSIEEAYANHIIAKLIGMIFGLFLAIKMFKSWGLAITNMVLHVFEETNAEIIALIGIAIFLLLFFRFMQKCGETTTAYISLKLHKKYKWLRDNYAKTNALIHIGVNKINRKNKNYEIEIDFSKIKEKETYREKYIILNKKVIIIKHNIVLTEYELTGECAEKVETIETKCLAETKEEKNDIDYGGYSMIINFKERPKSGTIKII